jgi:hypothetical protein
MIFIAALSTPSVLYCIFWVRRYRLSDGKLETYSNKLTNKKQHFNMFIT